MRQHACYSFGPFVLDVGNEQLRQGARALPLPPKAFALLQLFVERAGRLVTKDEILDALWRGDDVGESVLKYYVHVLRRALDDGAQAPSFIQTVHGRGYRFVGEPEGATAEGAAPAPSCVGRDDALARLRARFEACRAGRRQTVLLCGEAGIGKTTAAEAFLAQLGGDACAARGRCFSFFGAGQGAAWLPVLELLAQLYREPRLAPHRDLLCSAVPTWLLQLPPTVLEPRQRAALERPLIAPGPQRMLHEMAEGLEALSRAVPLLLLLEDLHCADRATLDLVGYLARRPQQARLLLVATVRLEEIAEGEHPLRALRQELLLSPSCEEIALGPLGEAGVAAYLAARFPADPAPAPLSRALHEQTGGHPLFLVSAVESWTQQGLLATGEGELRLTGPVERLRGPVPAGIRGVVAALLTRLPEADARLLEAASVAGMELCARDLAGAVGASPEELEARFAALARRTPFLRPAGAEERPRGAPAARFAFVHWLYHGAIYERVGEAERQRLHLAFAAALAEGRHAREPGQVAPLAGFYERGQDFAHAAAQQRRLAQEALRAGAFAAAEACLSRAAALARQAPPELRASLLIDVLQLRCSVRNVLGDQAGADEDRRGLLAEARRAGRVDAQIEAELDMS
jgi:DNA-binding winged helix-turn-helix (wHTH) protein